MSFEGRVWESQHASPSPPKKEVVRFKTPDENPEKGLSVLAADYSYRRWKAHEVARDEGFELSLVSVNLAYHLAGGSGRMNSTYMDEQDEGMMVCFPEFGRGYRKMDALRQKNCYPQQEGVRLIHTVLPFWAFRSKEKVDIRGRYYTSYLEYSSCPDSLGGWW